MRCPNCNSSEHEPNARFCHVCGESLTEPASQGNQSDPTTEMLDQGWKVQYSWERMRERQQREEKQAVSAGTKVLRYCLLLVVLFECIWLSFKESIYGSWGLVTIGYLNGFVIVMTLALTIFANQSHFTDKQQGWRHYYEWLHYLAAAIVPVLGYLIVSNIQDFWTLVLDSFLLGSLFLADFGVLEDIVDL